MLTTLILGNATSAREVAAGETATGHGSTLLVGVATLALAASLLTRGLAPALPGVWVGVDHLITALKLVSAIASQLFAVCSTALVIALVLAAVRSRLGAFFRSLAVGVGVLTILGVMAASAVALPEEARLVLAVAATALALLAGFGAVSRPALRGGALVLAAVGVAGMGR